MKGCATWKDHPKTCLLWGWHRDVEQPDIMIFHSCAPGTGIWKSPKADLDWDRSYYSSTRRALYFTLTVQFWSLATYTKIINIYIYIYLSSSILNTGLLVSSVPIQYIEKRTLPTKPHTHPKTLIAELCWSVFFQSGYFEMGGDELQMDNLAH